MTKLVLDQKTLSMLLSIQGRAELCDDSGVTVGHFLPMQDRALYASAVVPISEEELQRAEAETGGRALAGILADLFSLGEASP